MDYWENDVVLIATVHMAWRCRLLKAAFCPLIQHSVHTYTLIECRTLIKVLIVPLISA